MKQVSEFYKRISGTNDFLDNTKQLNYLEYFGIGAEDLKSMFALIQTNLSRANAFLTKLTTKITELFEKYCLKIQIKTGEQLKAVNKNTHDINQALITNILYLGCRVLAQEFVMLMNVEKMTYKTPITVFKFGAEKHTYRSYVKGLRCFYESLSAWTYKLMNLDQNLARNFSFMDDMLASNSLDLKAYKKIFMLIWMHGYIKQASDANELSKQLDSESKQVCEINFNVLDPINFQNLLRVKESVAFNDSNSLENFKTWRDKSYIENIKELRKNELAKLPYNDEIKIFDYFLILKEIAYSFKEKDLIDYQKYSQPYLEYLCEITKNKYSMETIHKILTQHLYNTDNKFSEDIIESFYDNGCYLKLILVFTDHQNYLYLGSFPEIILMAIYCQEEFILLDPNVRKNILKTFDEIIATNVKEHIKKIPKRFSSMQYFDLSQVPYFASRASDGSALLQPDGIIYESNLNKCLFFVSNLFVESPRIWIDAKNAMRLLLGGQSITRNILNRTYLSWERDFKKIKKQIKISNEATMELVIVVNRLFEINPKFEENNFVWYVVDVAVVEHFLTNYIYKK